jgi:tRNA (guanine26-N2/guanine27-N2)-dimethyltransferase
MYSCRDPSKQFDVIDLDPYGSAVPFLDGAVQAVTDGGLLCVTCTDLAILSGSSHPETCFAKYGGTPVRAEFCHEMALRLVLHALQTSAARYKRVITPLASFSIDFYIRMFVRVHTSPKEVKRTAR